MSKQKATLSQINVLCSIIALTELTAESDPAKAIKTLKNQIYLAINNSGYLLSREKFDQIINEQFHLFSKNK